MHKYPAIKLVCYSTLGCFVGFCFNLDFSIIISVSIISLIFSVFRNVNKFYRYFLICLSIGLLIQFNLNNSTLNFPNKIIPEFRGVFSGSITEIVKSHSDYQKMIVEGEIKLPSIQKLLKIKILVNYFHYDDYPTKVGDKIKANIKLKSPQKKILPTDFDEVNYFKSLGVLFKSNISKKNTIILPSSNFNIKSEIQNVRLIIKSKLKNIFKDSHGIIYSLLTGDKSQLDYSLINRFSKTGIAHVLAISGLHVGIIAFIIYQFLIIFRIRNEKIKLISFISITFLFIVFTGFQPSALRAFSMISLYFILKFLGRKPEPLNILFFVSIIFLLIDPNLLYSIGFQLSFAAVLSILLLYSSIYKSISYFITSENKFFTFIKSSFSISISATLGTQIISAYHFNVFSITYPISNLFIIPLVVVLLSFSIISLILYIINSNIGEFYALSADYVSNLIVNTSNYFYFKEIHSIDIDYKVIISIISFILLFYIFLSNNKNLFIFRVIYSIIISSILFINIPKENEANIFVRKNFNAVYKEGINNSYLILIDRKKSLTKTSSDIGLLKYLLSKDKYLHIFITGYNSILFHDDIKSIIKNKSQFIRIEDIDNLSNILSTKQIYTLYEI